MTGRKSPACKNYCEQSTKIQKPPFCGEKNYKGSPLIGAFFIRLFLVECTHYGTNIHWGGERKSGGDNTD